MNLSRRPSDRLGPPQGERMDPGEKSSFPSLPPVPGTPVSSVAAGCPSAVVKSFAPVAGCSVREADGSIRCAGEGEKAFIHTANKPTGGGQGLKVKGQERVGRVCGFTGLPRRTKKQPLARGLRFPGLGSQSIASGCPLALASPSTLSPAARFEELRRSMCAAQKAAKSVVHIVHKPTGMEAGSQLTHDCLLATG